MAVARLALDSPSDGGVRLSDEIELYQRTYNTLLRSSGETHLRVLEPSHRAIRSSLVSTSSPGSKTSSSARKHLSRYFKKVSRFRISFFRIM